MKFAILLRIARQVEGEYILATPLRAHVNPDVLYRYLRENSLPTTTVENNIPYFIEYGVIENLELEGVEG